MFIAAHLPNYLLTLDMPEWLPGTAISLIGVTNLAGTLIFGWLGDRYSKKYLLSMLYFLRSLVIAAFIFFPISPTSVLIFSASIGFLWLATVPLTNALVGQLFGIKYLGDTRRHCVRKLSTWLLHLGVAWRLVVRRNWFL